MIASESQPDTIGPDQPSRPWIQSVVAVAALLLGGVAAWFAQDRIELQPVLSASLFGLGAALAILGSFLNGERGGPWPIPPKQYLSGKRCLWLIPAGLMSLLVFGLVLAETLRPQATVLCWLASLALIWFPLIFPARQQKECEEVPDNLESEQAKTPNRPVGVPPGRVAEAGAVLLLLVVGLAFRLPYLERFPVLIHVDEGNCGLMAREVESEWQQGTLDWFRPRSFYGFNTLGFVPGALFQRLFESDLYGLRLQNVVFGMLALVFVYLVARDLFGIAGGLVVLGLGATAHCAVEWSRNGLHAGHIPFLASLCAWLLWRGVRSGKRHWFVLTGFGLGASLVTYTAGAAVALWLFSVGGIGWCCSRGFRKRFTLPALLTLFSLLVFLAPVISWHVRNQMGLSGRSGSLIFSQDPNSIRHMKSVYGEDYLEKVLKTNLKNLSLLFNATKDTSTQYGFKQGGFVDPVSAALLVLGLSIGLTRIHRFPYWALLLGIAIPWIFGGVLTMDAPQYPRLAGITLLVGFLPMIWAREVYLAAGKGLGKVGTGLAGLTIAATVVLIGWTNFDLYFRQYDSKDRSRVDFESATIVREIERWGNGNITYVYEPHFHHNFRERPHLFVAGKQRSEPFSDLNQVRFPVEGTLKVATFVIPPTANDLLKELLERFPGGMVNSSQAQFRTPETILLTYRISLPPQK